MDLQASLRSLREIETLPANAALTRCLVLWSELTHDGLRSTHDALLLRGRPTWSYGLGRRMGVDPGRWEELSRRPLWFAPGAGRLAGTDPETNRPTSTSCDVWIDQQADMFFSWTSILSVRHREVQELVAIPSASPLYLVPGPDFGQRIIAGTFLAPAINPLRPNHAVSSPSGQSVSAELPRAAKAAIKHALEFGIGPAPWTSMA